MSNKPVVLGGGVEARRLQTEAGPVTYNEIVAALGHHRYIRSVIIESEQDSHNRSTYICYLLLSWTQRYHVLNLGYPNKDPHKPRQFRDLDRLLNLVRREFGYLDTIALRVADGTEPQKEKRFRAS